jgi:hypothetical protein
MPSVRYIALGSPEARDSPNMNIVVANSMIAM